MQTSDVGEAFRPLVPPAVVTAAYGVSWLYLVGCASPPIPLNIRSNPVCCNSDVSYESYKAYRKGPTPEEAAHFSEPTRIGMIATKRAVFQSIASMYGLSPPVSSFDCLTRTIAFSQGIAGIYNSHRCEAGEEGVHERL